MTDLIHGFTPTYEGQDVKSLKFQATYPACQANITIRASSTGEFVIQVTHADLLPLEAFDGMALIMDYVKEHKELPGKKTIPVWLPTDLPEGWSWKPRSKARPRSENQLQHWMLSTKSNCRVAFWHREANEWSLCSTRASQVILTVLQKALDNYRNAQFDEELAAGWHK